MTTEREDDVLAIMDAPDDREHRGKHRDILDLKTPYAPTPHEERLLGQHEDKKAKQPPKLRVNKGPGLYFAIVPDHADEKIGTVATMQSIGTNDPGFFNAIAGQLSNLTAKDGSVDERRLASAFALVQAVEPTNGIEGMLAAQMCAVHMESMKMAARLARTESQEMADIALPAFNKLVRTFVMQVEALKRLRSTGEQIVRHQYVHVSDGGQAVVGDVFPQEGGALKRVEQSRLDYAPGVVIEGGVPRWGSTGQRQCDEERQMVGGHAGRAERGQHARAAGARHDREARRIAHRSSCQSARGPEFSDTEKIGQAARS